jgi:hypothetical protein
MRLRAMFRVTAIWLSATPESWFAETAFNRKEITKKSRKDHEGRLVLVFPSRFLRRLFAIFAVNSF